eukprot:5651481-Amphidinium_carterae.2
MVDPKDDTTVDLSLFPLMRALHRTAAECSNKTSIYRQHKVYVRNSLTPVALTDKRQMTNLAAQAV